MQIQKKTYEKDELAVRIYDWMLGKFEALPSRKSVKKALDNGRVRVNGTVVRTGYWMQEGDVVELHEAKQSPPKPYRMKVNILFEDDYLIAIDKPAGLLVSGNQFKTAYNVLAHNAKSSSAKDALVSPLPVHRLDQATSGVLLAAKTQTARIKMGELFENRDIQKTYVALVIGQPKRENGTIEIEVDNKTASTHYKMISHVRSLKFGQLSMLELKPSTGRKHQLRKHLHHIGHSILGDPLYYSEDKRLKHKGMFLHAKELAFKHPITGKAILIQSEIPKKYKKRLENESKRYNFTMQA